MSMRTALAALLLRAGVVVHSRRWLPGADNPEFEAMLAKVSDSTMVTRDALFSLYLLARECEQREIPGAFVEHLC